MLSNLSLHWCYSNIWLFSIAPFKVIAIHFLFLNFGICSLLFLDHSLKSSLFQLFSIFSLLNAIAKSFRYFSLSPLRATTIISIVIFGRAITIQGAIKGKKRGTTHKTIKKRSKEIQSDNFSVAKLEEGQLNGERKFKV